MLENTLSFHVSVQYIINIQDLCFTPALYITVKKKNYAVYSPIPESAHQTSQLHPWWDLFTLISLSTPWGAYSPAATKALVLIDLTVSISIPCARYPFILLGEQRHLCVNILPKDTTRQRPWRASNQ